MLSGQLVSQMGSQIGPWIGYALGALAALALLWASFEFGSPDSRLNVVLLVSGGLIGWVAGVLLSPSSVETARFSAYGTALSTFVGGYLVAKLDRVFEVSVREHGDVDAGMVGRALLFVGGLALGVLFTFVWRTYISLS